MVNLAIVEDHRMFRDFLKELTSREKGYRIIGEAGDAAAARELIDSKPIDLLILDLNLPDGDGFEIAEHALQVRPEAKILALSSHCDEYTISRILSSGVHGFVDKNDQSADVLREAIAAVAGGRLFFTEAVSRVKRAIREDPRAFTKIFTEREIEILCLIGSGLSDLEVARRTTLSASTIQWHRKRILSRLRLHSTRDLIRYALGKGITRMNLVRPPGSTVP
ncbi:transcriptional regulatory protein DegU [mine drainage metagenome]|uniref:Transcriptional regulatory protein DegU n=1 Tax=mine drainage metagenome TaxID=410659 RepID=A0A1J5TRB9_9ZZZZ